MSTAQSPPESAGTAGAAAAVEPGPWPAHHRIGSFEIVTVLRTGDAGVLYRAWDHALAQPVLLEEFMPPALAHQDAQGQMRPSLPAAAAVLERAGRLLIEEARVLAHGNHPNLARVLHLVEAHGTAYRVLPGYSGRPLADLLAAGEAPHEERDIRTLLTDLLGALQAWQAQAGAHGGVNAAQVLWLEEGHALLLGPDSASQTPLGHAGGPAAPGGAGDPAAFGPAGGHVAFGGAAGHAVFAGDLGANQAIVADLQAAAALARACLKARPSDSSRPPLSPDLAATLDAVLSPDPAQWPAHAAQFRQWLAQGPPGRAAAPEPPPASPVSPAPPRFSPEPASSAPSTPPASSTASPYPHLPPRPPARPTPTWTQPPRT